MEFNEQDLEWTTYEAEDNPSQPGSAKIGVQVTHKPTGKVARCGCFTTQFRNKQVCLSELARILKQE